MKYLKYVCIAVFFPVIALADNVMECESFSGNWSRASVKSTGGGFYTIEVRLWGKKPEVFKGEMEFLGYRDREEYDNSSYEEVNFLFLSEDLEDLEIKYTQTSDGADYLYLQSSTINSSLSCR